MPEREMETPAVPLVMPPDELAAVKCTARILANIVARNHQAMEAARIEMRQNGPHKAMQWILNSLPDVWDDPETEWNGTETADEWFDRTEAFYRAAMADAEAAGIPSPSPASPEPDTAAMGAGEGTWRERAETAEERLLELENAVGWNTSCTSCSRVLDSAYAETVRAERAEARLAEIAAHVRERLNAPGRAGMSRAAAGIILGIAEGSGEEAGDGVGLTDGQCAPCGDDPT